MNTLVRTALLMASALITLSRAGFALTPSDLDGPLFDKTAVFTPRVAISEAYSEFIAGQVTPGDPDPEFGFPASVEYLEASAHTASLLAVVSIAGVNLGGIGQDTPFALIIGDYEFSATLGEGTPFTQTATGGTARFRSDDGTRTLTLTWTARTLTVSLRKAVRDNVNREEAPSFDSSESFFHGALADYNEPIAEDTTLGLRFGTFQGTRRLDVKGRGVQREVNKLVSITPGDPGDPTDPTDNIPPEPNYEQFDLSSYSVTASADYVSPVVAFNQPAANAVVYLEESNVRVYARGAATVQVRVNGGEWSDAEQEFGGPGGETALDFWNVAMTLAPGPNILEMQAVDQDGNQSVVIKRTVKRELRAGIYSALLDGTGGNDKQGLLSVTVGATGAFTGRVTFPSGRVFAFRGAFGETGSASVVIPRTSVAINLQLTLEGDQNQLTGSITDETGTLTQAPGQYEVLAGARTLANAAHNPSNRVGHYTATLKLPEVIASAPNFNAAGYLLIDVTTAGGVRLTGKLADGTVITFGGLLTGADELPLFLRLYAAPFGRLAGVVRFLTEQIEVPDYGTYEVPTVVASLGWAKPQLARALLNGPFATELDLRGTLLIRGYRYYDRYLEEYYEEPITGSYSGEVTFTGGLLAVPVTHALEFQAPSRAVSEVGSGLNLAINNTTGLITGSFLEGTVRRAFTGVLVSEHAYAGGYRLCTGAGVYIGTTAIGGFELEALGPPIAE